MSSQILALIVVGAPIAGVWSCLALVPTLNRMERLSLAIGFGLALSSVEFFLWRLFGLHAGFLGLDVALWAAVGAAGLIALPAAVPRRTEIPPRGHLVVWLALTAVAASLLVATTRQSPAGSWDAWAIWNLRAEFMASPGASWKDGFTEAISWSHPDYPLLIPAAIGRAWYVLGEPLPIVPGAVALLFTAATALLLVGALSKTQPVGRVQAAAAVLLVPGFLLNGASQCADVPLSFFILATAALLSAGPVHNSVSLGLAGFAAGCAIWTKNEGVVAALAIPGLYLAESWRRHGLLRSTERAWDIVAGLAPMILVTGIFKLLLAPENDIVSGILAPGALEVRLHDTGRMQFVARYMVMMGFGWGGWPVAGPMPLLLAIAALGTGRGNEATAAIGKSLVAFLAVFYAVYVLTPHSAAWHLATSWHRLIAQVWPLLVWWAFNWGSQVRSVHAPAETPKGSAAARVSGCSMRRVWATNGNIGALIGSCPETGEKQCLGNNGTVSRSRYGA